jgi:transposase
MHVGPPICCGLAVHQARLTACVRHGTDAGQGTPAWRECGTLYAELLALRDWLVAQPCPVVAMESPGVSWQPISPVLVGVVEVLVGNARERRPRPGHKSDPADARWLAELFAHGLIRPSFVPPPEPRAWRALTRTRVGLGQTRTQAKKRGQKGWEESNSKLARVVSDVFGKSGRPRRQALLEGARDAQQLASLALGRLRRKLPALAWAFTGPLTEHPGRLLALALARIELLERQIAELDEQIRRRIEPFLPQLEQLDRLPGVEATAARDLVGERGPAMRRLGSAARLASWAKVSPGNNASAGKRRQGRTGTGNRYVRRVLVPGAWAARTTSTFLGRPFRRCEARLGGKRAAVAVGHKSLVSVSHLLWQGTS